MIDEQIWTRRAGEGIKAFEAFQCYLRLGAERSIDKVFRFQNDGKTIAEGRRAPAHYFGWSVKFEWLTRADAYDRHMEAQNRKKDEEEYRKKLEEFRNRAETLAQVKATLATKLLKTAIERFERLNWDEIEVQHLPALLRAADALGNSGLDAEAKVLAVSDLLNTLENAKSS